MPPPFGALPDQSSSATRSQAADGADVQVDLAVLDPSNPESVATWLQYYRQCGDYFRQCEVALGGDAVEGVGAATTQAVATPTPVVAASGPSQQTAAALPAPVVAPSGPSHADLLQEVQQLRQQAAILQSAVSAPGGMRSSPLPTVPTPYAGAQGHALGAPWSGHGLGFNGHAGVPGVGLGMAGAAGMQASMGLPPAFGGHAGLPTVGCPPFGPCQPVDDEALANLLMAWYYSGYYTGHYAARQGK